MGAYPKSDEPCFDRYLSETKLEVPLTHDEKVIEKRLQKQTHRIVE